MNENKIVIITGGSFQGKSLISLSLAAKLNYSGVLTTDAVRNVLTVLYPDKSYFSTSTYLLSVEDFAHQIEQVSEIIKGIIEIYESRGERMIIEGMHFSSAFFEWAKEKNFCRICLDNQLSFEQRIILKKITRSKLRKMASGNSSELAQNINNENVKATSYYQHRDRIEEIHKTILKQSEDQDFQIVKFTEIELGIKATLAHINDCFLHN